MALAGNLARAHADNGGNIIDLFSAFVGVAADRDLDVARGKGGEKGVRVDLSSRFITPSVGGFAVGLPTHVIPAPRTGS